MLQFEEHLWQNLLTAYELLKKIASNNYQWPYEKSVPRRSVGILDMDVANALTIQVPVLIKKFDTLAVHSVQSPFVTCDLCGKRHSNDHYLANS